MNPRDRIEREHSDSTHGYRVDLDDRPSRQELRDLAKIDEGRVARNEAADLCGCGDPLPRSCEMCVRMGWT